MTIKDESTLNLFRGLHFCGWCGQSRICVPHHLHCRGAGGGSRLDVRINLIALCCDCHFQAHSGEIVHYDLKAKVASRERTTQDRINAAIWALLRAPKGSNAQAIIDQYLYPEA